MSTKEQEKPHKSLRVNKDHFFPTESPLLTPTTSNTLQAEPERKLKASLKISTPFNVDASVHEPSKPVISSIPANNPVQTPYMPGPMLQMGAPYMPQMSFNPTGMSQMMPGPMPGMYYPIPNMSAFQVPMGPIPNMYTPQPQVLKPTTIPTQDFDVSKIPLTTKKLKKREDKVADLKKDEPIVEKKEEPVKKEEPKPSAPVQVTPVQPTPVQASPVKHVEEPARKQSIKKEEAPAAPAVEDEPVEGSDEEGEEEEDFSKYPQERPERIVYTREMILEFIERESRQENPEIDEQLEDLMRVIEGVPKGKDYPGSSKMGNSSRGRDNGRTRGYNEYPKSGKSGYNRDDRTKGYGKPQDSYGSGYNKRNDFEVKTPVMDSLKRATLTADEKKRIDEIRNATDDLTEKAKNADEETVLKRSINLSLFKLTNETLDGVFEDLKPLCQTPESCQVVVQMLIDKAWSGTKYTDIYAELCSRIGNLKFPWFENMTPERRQQIKEKFNEDEDPQKLYKNLVLNKIRNEFMNGFESFKKMMVSAEGNPDYSDEDKLAVYNKAKGKVLANMSFIAGLYQRKYLPHKVMRIISFSICTKYVEDFTRDDSLKYKFSTAEVFIEAFFKIMETCGDIIEMKEEKEDKSRSKETIAKMKVKSEEWVAAMIKAIVTGKYVPEQINSKLNENDRKEVNFVSLVFNFLKQLRETKKIATRLDSLIHNAFESRRSGWKSASQARRPQVQQESESNRGGGNRRDDRRDDRGDRGGRDGRSKRYEDDYKPVSKSSRYDDEYEKKQPESRVESKAPSKKSDVDFEIKTIFTENKTTDSIETYADLFKADNPAINGSSPEDIMYSYLKHFTATSASIADIRTQIALMIVQNFKMSESAFFSTLSTYILKSVFEDIPFLKKAVGKIIALVVGKAGFDIFKLSFKLADDADERDEQKWFLMDIFDEAEKVAKDSSLGLDGSVASAIQQYKTSQIKTIS